MSTTITLVQPGTLPAEAETLVVVGRKARLNADDVRGLLPTDLAEIWPRMLDALEGGDAGASTTTWRTGDGPSRVVVAVLPEACGRHASPTRAHALGSLIAGGDPGRGEINVLVALETADHALAAAASVARAFPLYTRKGGAGDARTASVALVAPEGPMAETTLEGLAPVVDSVRLAGRLVDMPPDDLNTEAYVGEARAVAKALGCEINVILGGALADAGFGGLWGVGRAASRLPALVVLSHTPEGATETVVLAGKGIVYDTGGLSIKGKEHMPGMKADMGGSAAVLGAFQAAVSRGAKQNLHAILCLAENAVGPESIRPDDVLTMYSGRTVEVNNTDAEGRLVLADGVAYAAKHLNPDVIIDLATLTGAQLVSTGRLHAAILCNDDALEARALEAGRATGDLVHPLPWAPELFRKEFKSTVADMKNSVKDRMNAQSSCAGLFIYEHLCDYEGPWLHIDMAGPATRDDRGTGYGVALLVRLLEG